MKKDIVDGFNTASGNAQLQHSQTTIRHVKWFLKGFNTASGNALLQPEIAEIATGKDVEFQYRKR